MKSTKNKLLSSIATLLVCFAMLIGSTYAWFTDTASTGINKIQAGNLDIEFEYLKDGDWKSIDAATDLFQTDLWEPGTTDVVYLRAKNNGTLALKYKFAVNKISEVIGVNKDNGQIKLSAILKCGITVSESLQTLTREQARALANNSEKVLSLNTYSNDIRLGVNEVKYYTVAVFMPETVENEANYKTGTTPPQIELGIDLVATQDTVERDSFGNDYDINAKDAEGYQVTFVEPVVTVSKALQTTITTTEAEGTMTAVETVRGEQTVNAGGIDVTYPEGTKLATSPVADSTESTVESTQDAKQGFTYTGEQSDFNITIEENQKRTVYELTLPVSDDNNTLVKVVEKIASNLTVEAVYHDGTQIDKLNSATLPVGQGQEAYYYDSATGELILWVYHASEVTTVTKNKAPVESMFPDVNVTILSEVVEGQEITFVDTNSPTTATIPADAIDNGIVTIGQKIYLVIITTVSEENSKTYDISIRDANGNPFNWTVDCMPEVSFCLGKAVDLFPAYILNIWPNPVESGLVHLYDRRGAEKYPESEYGNQYFNGTGEDYGQLKYGEEYDPGVTYNPESGIVTLRSLTFE